MVRMITVLITTRYKCECSFARTPAAELVVLTCSSVDEGEERNPLNYALWIRLAKLQKTFAFHTVVSRVPCVDADLWGLERASRIYTVTLWDNAINPSLPLNYNRNLLNQHGTNFIDLYVSRMSFVIKKNKIPQISRSNAGDINANTINSSAHTSNKLLVCIKYIVTY